MEIFFSILARRVLRRGDFVSRQNLIDKLLAFIAAYNLTAKTLPLDLRRQTPQGRMTPDESMRRCTDRASVPRRLDTSADVSGATGPP
jgi:hypothetical protein